MLRTIVAAFLVLMTCQILTVEAGWAERRWEARFDACEKVLYIQEIWHSLTLLTK